MANQKIAIDLDSAYTSIYMVGSGLVLSESTVAAVSHDEKNEIKAVGEEAKKLIGKTSKNTKIVFPIFEGEIVNEGVTISMLDSFLSKIGVNGASFGSKTLISIPCGTTYNEVEKYKLVAKKCGLGKTYFVEAPILSALGQRIPLNDSSPCFVIDMAGGTTNIAAVTLDGVIAGISVNFGANKISTDIIDYVSEQYGLQIGLLTAERLKNDIGSLAQNDGLSTVVNGRDVKTGVPKSISLRAMDIFEPIEKYFDKIAEISSSILKKLSPEVCAEIRHAGVYVSGLASNVYGLENYLAKKLDIKVNVAENGRYSVALGGGIVVANNDLLKKLAIKI